MDAEDSLKVKADRMTGVSVGMMPPLPSGSRLGSAAAPQPGQEQEGCSWKCSSSLGLALWLQQVKWSKWILCTVWSPVALHVGVWSPPSFGLMYLIQTPDMISPYQGCNHCYLHDSPHNLSFNFIFSTSRNGVKCKLLALSFTS